VQEYVEIVRALAEDGKVSYQGELYRVQGQVAVKGAKPFPILIGALGERMRRIAGTIADGTITWMAGTAALRDTLIPDINAAAVGAGRPAPRIVASIPVALSEDRDAARSIIDNALAMYPQLPSYKAVLELGGATRPSDVAVIGDEAAIESALGELAEAGVTDLVPQPIPVGAEPKANLARLHELLAELARG
jgi:alkanesulfonate monooxygenase SsuD/methylene tetrahydromethanopterin reductase-like flavin-dependent oxidoreductase (luciferase family)